MVSRKDGLGDITLDTRDLEIRSVKGEGQTLRHSLDDPHKVDTSTQLRKEDRLASCFEHLNLQGNTDTEPRTTAGLGITAQNPVG